MWEVTTHMLADIAQIEGLEVSEAVSVEQNQNGHDFTVRHTGRTVTVPLARYFNRMFFNSVVKYLQKSSNIQNISIKFVSVIGVGIYL